MCELATELLRRPIFNQLICILGVLRGAEIPSLNRLLGGEDITHEPVKFYSETIDELKQQDELEAIERAKLESLQEEKKKRQRDMDRKVELQKKAQEETKECEEDWAKQYEKAKLTDAKLGEKLAKDGDELQRRSKQYDKELEKKKKKEEKAAKDVADAAEKVEAVEANPERVEELKRNIRVFHTEAIRPQTAPNAFTCPIPRHNNPVQQTAPTPSQPEMDSQAIAMETMSSPDSLPLTFQDIVAQVSRAVRISDNGDEVAILQNISDGAVKLGHITSEDEEGIKAKLALSTFAALLQTGIRERSIAELQMLFQAMSTGIEDLIGGVQRSFDGYEPVITWVK